MSKRPSSTRLKVLASILLASPLLVQAQPADRATEAVAVRTIPAATFEQWLREDTRLIDGIVASLTHIEGLVGDIERLLKQLPDFAAMPRPVAPMAAPPAPAPPPAPVVIEKIVEKEVPGPLGGWMPQLAGASLLALLAFWLGRRQGIAGEPARPVKPLPSPAPERHDTAVQEKHAVPPVVPPVAPAAREMPPAPSSLSLPSTEVPAAVEQPSLGQAEQTLELAEIMLSMGLGHGAIQTLTEQIRHEPKQALRHWLKLLEIYRKNGQQEEFERSAEELRLHFNVRPEDWHAQPGTAQTIENFPHIAKRLSELWGKPDCLVYMKNLLDDNRGGARSGFPQSVAEELLLLSAIMREAFGFTTTN